MIPVALSLATVFHFFSAEIPAKGWKTLFNGKNFSGWKVPDQNDGRWTIKGGVIDCRPKVVSRVKGKPRPDLNLWTKKSFKNFILEIDWRIKELKGIYATPILLPDGNYKKDDEGKVIKDPRPGADSGIYLRGTGKAQVNIWRWPVGSGEVYGYRNNKKNPPDIRRALVPRMNADKPVGEWNNFKITMKGDRITVVLNGKTVIENARLPDVPEKGPIALQHHGGYNSETKEWSGASSLVQFRNIRIQSLK